MEVQEGKDGMRKKDFSRELGATAGCTARLVRGSKYCGDNIERQTAEEEGKKEIVYGDSWFGSMVSYCLLSIELMYI